MLMAVFGAGASYDCIDDLQQVGRRSLTPSAGPHDLLERYRPPLTAGLVTRTQIRDVLTTRYRACLPLVMALDASMRSSTDEDPMSLENELQRYLEAADGYPPNRLHVASFLFYLRDMLWNSTEAILAESGASGATHYVTLVHALHQWAVGSGRELVLATFNYDLLLEAACNAVWGFSARSLDDYLADPICKILKPHGSVNWICELSQAQPETSDSNRYEAAISRFAEEEWSAFGSIEVVERNPAAAGEHPAYVPVLAMPVTGKTDLVCPRDQVDYLDNLDPFDRLLVVGWRGVESHVVERLRAAADKTGRLRVLVVAGGRNEHEGAAAAQEIAARLDFSSAEIREFGGGFSNLMGSGLVDWLLAD